MLDASFLFLRENWSDILFFVLLMVVYMIFVTLRNGVDKSIDNENGGEKKTVKTVVIETFLGDDFCASHSGNSQYLDKSCSKLNKSMCMATDCCVYAKYDDDKVGKCVAGGENGPTYLSSDDSETPLEMEYYYYKKKKLGLKEN
jgi:hypothetical protein